MCLSGQTRLCCNKHSINGLQQRKSTLCSAICLVWSGSEVLLTTIIWGWRHLEDARYPPCMNQEENMVSSFLTPPRSTCIASGYILLAWRLHIAISLLLCRLWQQCKIKLVKVLVTLTDLSLWAVKTFKTYSPSFTYLIEGYSAG